MLVISRKQSESLVMEDVIWITALEINPTYARLQIVCPKETAVTHGEASGKVETFPDIPDAYFVDLKPKESVVVGKYTVSLVEIRSEKVRLGFDPSNKEIHRREVWEAIQPPKANPGD